MRMGIAGSVARIFVLLGVIAMTVFAGCEMRPGMNSACEWPHEPSAALDPRDPAKQRHLVEDVRVAEELGIRYDDSQLRFGLAPSGAPQTRDECDTKLFTAIAETHSVSLADVREARRRVAESGPDPLTYLPLLALYAVVGFRIATGIRERFAWSAEKGAVVVATLLLSLVLSAALVQVGHLWGGLVEMIRVGNTHMSYRAVRLGWGPFAGPVFVLGCCVFWALVVVRYRQEFLSPEATALGSKT